MLREMMQNGEAVGILIVSLLPIGRWRNTQITLDLFEDAVDFLLKAEAAFDLQEELNSPG